MLTQANVDSLRYIIAYELQSRDEVPADFGPRDGLPEFQAGLFLPRAKPDWFGRSAYSACVLALVQRSLVIIPHPAARVAARSLLCETLYVVESASMLLHGLLRFVGADFEGTLFYHRRRSRVSPWEIR
jgi:hypothetical protein